MSPFPTRQLGADGPQVTAIGFGMMSLGTGYGVQSAKISEEQGLALLDHLYDTGCRFWDTADRYGTSEDTIGVWFQRNPEKRKHIILATKFGVAPGKIRNDREYMFECIESSLKRLNTDYIDLYFVHRIEREIPIEKTVAALVELKEKGLIRHLGLSEVAASSLRRACAVHHIAAVQVEYSPFAIDIELDSTGILSTCKELGIAVVAYAPLGRGMLSGQIKSRADIQEGDARYTSPRFSEEHFDKNMDLVNTFERLAAAKGAAPTQVALAWVLSQWDMVIPIPGTTKVSNYDQNMAAFRVKLTEQDQKEIREAIVRKPYTGERYVPGTVVAGTLMDTVPLEGAE